jgi:hypothetical protein
VFIGAGEPQGHTHSTHSDRRECKALAAQFNTDPAKTPDGRTRYAVCVPVQARLS